MKYKYHCQHEAESIANSIMPVPANYPLANGLPDDFIMDKILVPHYWRLLELEYKLSK